MNHITYKNRLAETTASAIGSELEIKVARNEKMFTEKRYEHEILFGTGFVRDGIPEPDLSKTYYGVTADGTQKNSAFKRTRAKISASRIGSL